MPSTTKLVDRAACLSSHALVDSLDSAQWGLVKLPELTQSREGRDSMGRPLALETRFETGRCGARAARDVVA
jgi:hypothetical protein